MYNRIRVTNERSKTLKETYSYKGVRYWREVPPVPEEKPKETLLRQSIGSVIRERRAEMGLGLRDINSVSMGYVSEVERGKKEMSSEILQMLAQNLDISVPELLRRTADRMDGISSPKSRELVNA